jgi:hypothetical protein
MNGIAILKYAIIAMLLFVYSITSIAQIQVVGCGTYTAGTISCGASYTDTYNGVVYHCICTCASTSSPATCTEANSGGSGGSIPGQTNPGDVSTDNIMEGKAIFTPHPSEAFNDWGESYKQLLESYGITSILGKNITPNQIKQTDKKGGKKGLGESYKNKSDSFNPKPPVVQLLTTPAQQAKRDAWMIDNGFEKLKKIPKEGIPLDESNFKLEEGDFWTTPEMIKLYIDAGKFALMFSGEGEVVAAVKEAISLGEDFKSYEDANKEGGGKIDIKNTLKKSAGDAFIGAVGQEVGRKYGSYGKILYSISVKDVKALYKYSTEDNH